MSLSSHLLDTFEDRKPPSHLLNHRPLQGGFHPNRAGNTGVAGPTNPHNPHASEYNATVHPPRGPPEPWMGGHGRAVTPPWVNGGSSNGVGYGGQGGQSEGTKGRFTPWSEEKIAQLQVRLHRKLGPEYVSQKPGMGGGKITYIEAWKVIELANEVFGFNGWSSSVISLKLDYFDSGESGKWSCGATAVIRITLADGTFHEDVGCGSMENSRSKAQMWDKAQKEAVTDGIKRCLKTFGNVLGNCLYDKDYNREIGKVKVPPFKLNHDQLERRPEFATPRPVPAAVPAPSAAAAPTSAAGPSRGSALPSHITNAPKPPVPGPSVAHAVPPAHAAPDRSIRQDTPLRSIDESFLIDENFDAEFMDMAGSDFFNEVDESVGQTTGGDQGGRGSAGGASPTKAQPVARSMPQQSAPAYQHRHRPDMPAAPAPKSPVKAAAAAAAGASPAKHSNAGGFAPSTTNPTITANVHLPADGGAVPRSSGGSSHTADEAPKPPARVGGFAFPSGPGAQNSAASAARALAIASAMRASPQPHLANQAGQHPNPPIRAESPRIPSGGISEAAARASTNFRATAAKLDLSDEQSFGGGFSSARGIKRSGGEDSREASASPTKKPSGGVKSGPRQALGELSIEGGEPDGWHSAKRQRAA